MSSLVCRESRIQRQGARVTTDGPAIPSPIPEQLTPEFLGLSLLLQESKVIKVRTAWMANDTQAHSSSWRNLVKAHMQLYGWFPTCFPRRLRMPRPPTNNLLL